MIVTLIPCYQAAALVGDVVARCKPFAPGPIVVVDDGSVDGSGEVAARAGATVLRHPQNRGKGAALQSGFAYAKTIGASAVVTLDADGQHDPAEIPALAAVHAANPTALVLGVRSFAADKMPRRSRIGNRISTWWISRFAGHHFSDTQTGFRLYPTAFFAGLQLRTQRFDTETELLLRAARGTPPVPIIEHAIATIYNPGHVSHFHGLRDTLRVIRLVITSPIWTRV